MDNLFPLTQFSRQGAVWKLIIGLQSLQSLAVAGVLVILGEPVTALLTFVIILAVSFVTVTVLKNKKK